jgi:hypothetical protein
VAERDERRLVERRSTAGDEAAGEVVDVEVVEPAAEPDYPRADERGRGTNSRESGESCGFERGRGGRSGG